MENSVTSTHPEVEIVYLEPEYLDEQAHYSNLDLVREINKLKKQIHDLDRKVL